MSEMIPITLVTGFLGSGKTTLLEEIFKKNHQRKIIYLVNDYTVRDVDGNFFSKDDRKVLSVYGGSIFCTCKGSEFVNKLNDVGEMEKEIDNPIDGLVIEASGIANPSVIQSLLVDSGMDRFYRLNNIISVTDPISLPKLKQTLPNIVQQIKTAKHIILNKSDLVSNSAVEDVVLEIKKINNKSQIHVTKYCRINFNPLDSDEKRFGELSSDSVHGEDPAYAKYSIQIHRPINLDRLKQLLKENPNTFYRIKGIFLDDNEKLQNLDYSVSSGLNLYPPQSRGQPHLEFIFAGENREKIIGELRLFSREGFIKEV
jgi:G3E family GTPase